jgi:hypothetical protein
VGHGKIPGAALPGMYLPEKTPAIFDRKTVEQNRLLLLRRASFMMEILFCSSLFQYLNIRAVF